MKETLRKNFPLTYLQTMWIDTFEGYEFHIGEDALVIPAGCGGGGFNTRRIEAYPYPDSLMRDHCIQVSYASKRVEGGRQMCGPEANPHEVIPLSCLPAFLNLGIDILNARKRELIEEYGGNESALEYRWGKDPIQDLWRHLHILAYHDNVTFTDNDKWREFCKNWQVNHVGVHV